MSAVAPGNPLHPKPYFACIGRGTGKAGGEDAVTLASQGAPDDWAAKTTTTKKVTKPKTKLAAIEPKTVAEAKKLEEKNDYWQLNDDEVLLRSPNPEDEYKTSDSWRVFRIMGEFVNGFDSMATIPGMCAASPAE